MTVPDTATLTRMLEIFIDTLEPHKGETAAVERAWLEGKWLLQEWSAGRLELPLGPVNALFLTHATTEGWLDRVDGAHDQALALIDACTEPRQRPK